MDPTEIKIELIRNNISQADIARGKGVTPTTVHRVIRGQSVSDPVQQAIAKAINKPVTKVFPDRYPLRGKVVSRPDPCIDRAAS
jgi:transcriptional regulator with XRE-family HTH domain